MAPPDAPGPPPSRPTPLWIRDALIALFIALIGTAIFGGIALGLSQLIAPGRNGLMAAVRLLPYLLVVNTLGAVIARVRSRQERPQAPSREDQDTRPAN